MKISYHKFLLTMATASCLLCLQDLHAQTEQRPNIIFIIGDDMERDMFNCLPEHAGKNLSPNIDRIATEGVVFPQFHCASPACTPSRYNVLTGRYGSRERSGSVASKIASYDMAIIGWNTHILSDDVTVAKLLKNAGYKTGFVGKNHVVTVSGYNKNISSSGDPTDPTIKSQLLDNANLVETAIKNVGFDFAASVYHNNPINLNPDVLAVHNMDWVCKGGLDFIDQYKDDPFFLYFSTTLTHAPYGETDSWNADPLATPEGILDTPLDVMPDRSTIIPRLAAAGVSTNNNDHLPHLLAFDDAVGALFDKIEEHGLDDNTLVFFFNDHGVEKGKSTCYEGGTLAMSMAWKKDGFPSGVSSNAFISNVDFAPTILDYAGVEVPFNQFDGKSFRPILEGTASAHRKALYYEMGCVRGIQIDNWKYMAVRYPTSVSDPVGNEVGQVTLRSRSSANNLEIVAMDAHPYYFDSEQFYDLSADPAETNNLAGLPEHAGRIAEMQAELVKYLNPLPGGFAEFKSTNDELHQGSLMELF